MSSGDDRGWGGEGGREGGRCLMHGRLWSFVALGCNDHVIISSVLV